MTQSGQRDVDGKAHRFGGDWTSKKLEVIRGYLESYNTVLKSAPFKKAYIDAFAGTGYRKDCRDVADGQGVLFPDLAAKEPQALLDGSARIALRTEPRFDSYIFIERNEERCRGLSALKTEFPGLAEDISVLNGEANEEIRRLCGKNWDNHRAVLFLDPYGMQVEWETIEAVAKTKCIDLWVLFPLGMGANRLLTRSGEIPESWRERLNVLLGTDDWYDKFYKVTKTSDLFWDEQGLVGKATMGTIGRYFNERLKTVFSGVSETPGILWNSRNNPLYLLCFAVGNEHAKNIALRVANHLLKGMQ